MGDTADRRYPVFLSSLCRELIDLRSSAYNEIGRGKAIYVDECATPRHVAHQDDLTAVDDLIRRVRDADLFVCVLGGKRHGSPITVAGHPSAVSFFEIELYQAALLGKGIRIYVRSDFEPDARLSSLLEVLDFAFGDWRSLPRQTDAEILAHLSRDVWLRAANKAFDSITFRSALRRLVQAMFARRARSHPAPSVCFLNNEKESSKAAPDLSIVASIQQNLRTHPNEERRLSRIWIAIRELMASHYSSTLDPEILRLWNETLGSWTSAGAWYGLHGDMPLGCLAALNSQQIVRQKLIATAISKDDAARYAYAGGALASAKYSIAKYLYVAEDREARFTEALQDVQRAINEQSAPKSDLLAIRGSIMRSSGRLSEAIEDYEEVLRDRIREHYPHCSVGEAESELGYGYLSQWRLRKGLEFCQEGVRKLRDEPSRKGFLIRGLRKLAVAYALNGRLLAAYDTRQEMLRLVNETAAYDQLS